MNRWAIALCLFVVVVPPAYAAQRIVVDCKSSAPCGAITSLALERDGRTQTAPVVGGVAIVDTPGPWSVVLKQPGFWSAPAVLDAEASELRLAVWRTGAVKLRDISSGAVEALQAVVTTVPLAPNTASLPSDAVFSCQQHDRKMWTCELPASRLDIALRSPGRATQYVWDVVAGPGTTVDIGNVRFPAGASIVAWLDAGTAKAVDGTVWGALYHQAAAHDVQVGKRLSAPVARGRFSKRGMLQLTELPSGVFLLEVSAKGFASTQVTVRAERGRELRLRQPVTLERPVNARLTIAPPRTPASLPWRVTLTRQSSTGAGWHTIADGQSDESGQFWIEQQASGTARVVIRDERGNKFASRELLISRDSVHPIDLSLITVAGVATIGEEPMADATLVFGMGAEKVTAHSNESGAFHVTLPRRGRWPVEGRTKEEGVLALTDVDVTEEDDLALKFPGTELSGVVRVKTAGAVNAEVTVMVARNGRTVRTGSDGSFVFRGLPKGTATLRAATPDGKSMSKVHAIAIPAEGRVANVVIDLEKANRVTGFVRSGGNAVIGAGIQAYAITGRMSQQRKATTGPDGAFSFDAPETAASVLLIVGAPGRVLQTETRPLGTEEPLVIDLASQGGTIRFDWDAGMSAVRANSAGALLPMAALVEWAAMQGQQPSGQSLIVPNLAPGQYAFCNSERCVETTLAPGGYAHLSLREGRPPQE